MGTLARLLRGGTQDGHSCPSYNRHRRHGLNNWRVASDQRFAFDRCSASDRYFTKDRRFACDPRVAKIEHVCRDVCENRAERSAIHQSEHQAGRSENALGSREPGWTATRVREGRAVKSSWGIRFAFRATVSFSPPCEAGVVSNLSRPPA